MPTQNLVTVDRVSRVQIVSIYLLSAPVIERDGERMLPEYIQTTIRQDGSIAVVQVDGTEAKKDGAKGFRSVKTMYYSHNFPTDAPGWLKALVGQEIERQDVPGA